MIQINTQKILFICGGAFDGIEKKIMSRMHANAIGYGANKTARIDRENALQYVAPQDLKSYGLIPELVGRIPVLSHLNPLDKDALRQILTEPKNSLVKQYTKLFEMDNKKLVVDDDVLDFIVEKAVEFKLGARGLRSICEAIMLDAMYEIPSDESDQETFRLTFDYARERVEKAHSGRLRAAS